MTTETCSFFRLPSALNEPGEQATLQYYAQTIGQSGQIERFPFTATQEIVFWKKRSSGGKLHAKRGILQHNYEIYVVDWWEK